MILQLILLFLFFSAPNSTTINDDEESTLRANGRDDETVDQMTGTILNDTTGMSRTLRSRGPKNVSYRDISNGRASISLM